MAKIESFHKHIAGKRILVSGGTGTIGQELIQRILPFEPEVIRIFSRDENKQYYLRDRFRESKNVRFLIGDVRDKDRVHRAMQDVNIVFHLAALKHVESCEYNPFEAIRTNIDGTQNVIDAALSCNVDRVVFSSTDKAVNPSNAMGASKLMAERLIVAANYYKGRQNTVFNTIRFGNVLASSGSVVPTFIARVREGIGIEVTDFGMTRFITTFSEAVELLLTALDLGEGGDIVIRKMPVINIKDLADVLVEEIASVYGHRSVPITQIGARAGEKLYEELLTEEESTRTFESGDYLFIKPLIGREAKEDSIGSQFALGAYTSRDADALSKNELRKLLYKEQLFSNPALMAGAVAHQRCESGQTLSGAAATEVN